MVILRVVLDPPHRGDQLEHLPETRHHADHEDEQDEAVQVEVRLEDGHDSGQGHEGPEPGQPEHDQHQRDLTDRL